jgi:hypothetical protein
MAKAIVTKVVVFDERLYHGHGDVKKWVDLITRHFWEHAVAYAPEREGRLKAGIIHETSQIGVRQVLGQVTSTAPYTMFVLRGTGLPGKGQAGYIFPKNGRLLRFGASGGYGPFVGPYVHGQKSDNFFERAWRATARNHRSIRGSVPLFIREP